MRTIFHSIKLLHLAQLATHTKVKERDLFLYDREEWRMCMREQVGDRKQTNLHNQQPNMPIYPLECKCDNVSVAITLFICKLGRVSYHIL